MTLALEDPPARVSTGESRLAAAVVERAFADYFDTDPQIRLDAWAFFFGATQRDRRDEMFRAADIAVPDEEQLEKMLNEYEAKHARAIDEARRYQRQREERRKQVAETIRARQAETMARRGRVRERHDKNVAAAEAVYAKLQNVSEETLAHAKRELAATKTRLQAQYQAEMKALANTLREEQQARKAAKKAAKKGRTHEHDDHGRTDGTGRQEKAAPRRRKAGARGDAVEALRSLRASGSTDPGPGAERRPEAPGQEARRGAKEAPGATPEAEPGGVTRGAT